MTLLRSVILFGFTFLTIFFLIGMATLSNTIEKSKIHNELSSPFPSPFPSILPVASAAVTITDFNFVAAGDWGCTSDTIETVKNVMDMDPELVLALGDLSYKSTAKYWLDIIEPVADKMMITIGNHETDSYKKLQDYMDYFGLKEQYYSFNYENVHFTVISTEIPYEEGSEQYNFVNNDLSKASLNPDIDWIVLFFTV